MSHYAVVQLVPTNADALAEYRKDALSAVHKHGGSAFAGGPESIVLEDGGAGATTVLIVRFPDAKAGQAWIDDPDLAALHALRNKGAKSTIVLLPELAG